MKIKKYGFIILCQRLRRVKAVSPAFTIVELLVVIVVIGILAAITIVSYTGLSSKASVASVQADLSNAAKILKLYYADYGVYPVSMPINGDGKYCPTDTKYCIKPSTNITYEYTPNNPSNPTSFCLTTIANSISYKVTDTSSPAQGDRNTYGLVLSLDAGNSASYPGSGTTWTDLSGLGNNGTLMNGPTYSSANGGSIVFDGANDYANMGASSTLNFGWTNLFSINSWIKTSQASGSYKIIVRKSTGGQGYVLSVDGSKATLYLVGAWAGNMIVIRSSNNINDGQWHHVTATYDGSKNASGSLVYVDGVNQSNIGQNTLTSDFLTSQAVGIADGTDGWGWYSGQISNVNIYNRVLLPAEITQNFNATKSRYGL